ncbi:MAG: hypothetical protein AAF471_03765 [Myxococcota bacterium]
MKTEQGLVRIFNSGGPVPGGIDNFAEAVHNGYCLVDKSPLIQHGGNITPICLPEASRKSSPWGWRFTGKTSWSSTSEFKKRPDAADKPTSV